MNVGDVVKIVHPGYAYNSYYKFATEYGLTKFVGGRYLSEQPDAEGGLATIVAIDERGAYIGIEFKDGHYVVSRNALEVIGICNGIDKDGKPKNFTAEDLKAGMRVKTKNGEVYIVMPNVQAGDGSLVLVDKSGWLVFRTDDNGGYPEYLAREVYDTPRYNDQVLNPSYMGNLLWQFKEPESELEVSEFDKRLAYFQTHIDAVKENLASLEAEYEQLKKQGK